MAKTPNHASLTAFRYITQLLRAGEVSLGWLTTTIALLRLTSPTASNTIWPAPQFAPGHIAFGACEQWHPASRPF